MNWVDVPSQAGNFIQLKDKDIVQGVFRGKFHYSEMHWVGSKSTTCPGKEICDLCRADPRSARFKFKVNFIVKEGDQYIAKIFEQGPAVYRQLKELNEEFSIDKNIIKISRSGSSQNDTRYTILPSSAGPVTPALEAKLATIELHKLDGKSDASINEDSGDISF